MKNYQRYLMGMLLLAFGLQAQHQHESFECIIEEDPTNRSVGGLCSPNGYYFTPKGDIRVLVVYVDFVIDKELRDEYAIGMWPFGDEFPTNHVDLNTGEILWAHDEFSDFSPIGSPVAGDQKNVSELFYHNSQGDLRMYFETLIDPDTRKPTNVTVEVDINSVTSRAAINELVFEKIREEYPQDWSRFDIRGDWPQFAEDASATFDDLIPESDNQLDFMVFVYRYNKGWGNQFMNGNPGNAQNIYFNLPLNGDYIGGPVASMHDLTNSNNTFFKRMIHEFGHAMYRAPHYAQANNNSGPYFYCTYYNTMMLGLGEVNTTLNAWERWIMGWTEITHDLDASMGPAATFRIQDYMQYGESMRVKMPHTDEQYLWLVYHDNDTNPFYDRRLWQNDALGNPIPLQPKGLYGFVERIGASRNMTSPTFSGRINGLKTINGSGNYDLTFDSYINRAYYYGNDVLNVTQGAANAYLGQHTATYFRHDFDGDGEIDFNTYSPNEGDRIVELDEQPVWGFLGNNITLPEKKLSAFTNPPLRNFMQFNKSPSVMKMTPMLLHSLSITSNSTSGGFMQVTVDYNDGHIEDDFRMTGNMFLPTNENITLNESKDLEINKSGSPNIHLQQPDGSFVTPSVFVSDTGSTFHLDDRSRVFLRDESTMIIKDGASLNMDFKSKILIKSGSVLCIKEGANVNLDPEARIVVNGGTLEVHPSIDLSANIDYVSLPPGPSNALGCDYVMYFGMFGAPVGPPPTSENEFNTGNVKASFGVEVSPNPNRGNFVARFDQVLDQFEYRLWNFSGNLVLLGENNGQESFQIDQALDPGIYLLQVRHKNEVVTTKVIIE